MSGSERMRARTGGHMASAATLAQLGISDGASATQAGGHVGGAGAEKAPGDRPELRSKDWLG